MKKLTTENLKTIAESNNFIVLDKYFKQWQQAKNHQSENELEIEFIDDLVNQGYEFLPNLNSPEAMLANVRVQLELLNNIKFSSNEWLRFVETTWINQVMVSLKKPAKFTIIIFSILFLMMGGFLTFICLIKRIFYAINFK